MAMQINPNNPFACPSTQDLEGRALKEKEFVTGSELVAAAPNVQKTYIPYGKPDDLVDSTKKAGENGGQLPQWATALSERALKKLGLKECEACEHRKYQDGSDDPGVSYKSAARISPEEAAVKVRAHEYEHVVRNQAKAEREDKEVLFQTVRIFTNICPECGRVYVSGGETRTVTKGKADQEFKPGSVVDFKV